jgi:hypothetical protein
MSKISRLKTICSILAMILTLTCTIDSHSKDKYLPDKVTTYKDENGWKLKVNGNDYYVKGIVWGYTPIGENYAYNLWEYPEEYIKNVLDYECTLMKNAGINTIRSFSLIPPKWVTYMYHKHGIMTSINHLMGRYGYTIGGVWRTATNYADPMTRKTLKRDCLAFIREYKDVPGILMFAFGNESNYGLEWSSFAIEDLPVGEQHKEKARALYSLFNEIMHEGKKIDKNHLFTIVNGDIQYLDLIKKYCTDMDVLGTNSYRGKSFTDLFSRSKKELGLPVLFFEFGSDAYNALESREDQLNQAIFLKHQWREMYNNTYGKEEAGNCIGGFIFEWRDEWWKWGQSKNLDIHDNTASWGNGGYSFDYDPIKKNNMNEEWFGICRLGKRDKNGVAVAEPRTAYYVISEIFKMDPYKASKLDINLNMNRIDIKRNNLQGDLSKIKNMVKDNNSFKLAGGSLKMEFDFNGMDKQIDADGKDGLNFSHGEMLYLDFEFEKSSQLKGDFTINILGNVPNRIIEKHVYGQRGKAYQLVAITGSDEDPKLSTVSDNERIEFYDFNALYIADTYDFNIFYHTDRFHWMYKGDFYGLLKEATDLDGMDIWSAKSPFGCEFTGKKGLEGLNIVMGPEIYWGANPKIMAKYTWGKGPTKYTFIHSEDIAQSSSTTGTSATEKTTRQTTFSLKSNIIPKLTLEMGGIMSGTEKIGDEFTYYEDDTIYKDEISFEDTLGFKTKMEIDASNFMKIYSGFNYGGLVADGGDSLKEFGSMLPYSGYGNKIVIEGGVGFFLKDYTIIPRLLYRENLRDANPRIAAKANGDTLFPGIEPRNRDKDPFAVLDNREAISGELIFTYDPTPSTAFYAWDNDSKEDAYFAFNIGGILTHYDTPTDIHLYYTEEFGSGMNLPFSGGLPDETVWKGKSKIVFNPNPYWKFVTKLELGYEQSTGKPEDGTKNADGSDNIEDGTRQYYTLESKITYNRKHILESYFKIDAWGPYDYNRDFNQIYPFQLMLDYSYLMDNFLDEKISSKIGIRSLFRTLDEISAENVKDEEDQNYMFDDELDDYMFEIITYCSFNF